MKKLFALMLALCLLGSCCAVAEEGTKEISWGDVEAISALHKGSFQAIADTGLIMYVPNSFAAVELTEEQIAQGNFFLLKDENNYRVSAMLQSLGTLELSDFVAEQLKAGATEMEEVAINGISAMSYEFEVNGEKIGCIAFYNNTDNTVLTLSFAPANDEAYQEIIALMSGSIQAAE